MNFLNIETWMLNSGLIEGIPTYSDPVNIKKTQLHIILIFSNYIKIYFAYCKNVFNNMGYIKYDAL